MIKSECKQHGRLLPSPLPAPGRKGTRRCSSRSAATAQRPQVYHRKPGLPLFVELVPHVLGIFVRPLAGFCDANVGAVAARRATETPRRERFGENAAKREPRAFSQRGDRPLKRVRRTPERFRIPEALFFAPQENPAEQARRRRPRPAEGTAKLFTLVQGDPAVVGEVGRALGEEAGRRPTAAPPHLKMLARRPATRWRLLAVRCLAAVLLALPHGGCAGRYVWTGAVTDTAFDIVVEVRERRPTRTGSGRVCVARERRDAGSTGGRGVEGAPAVMLVRADLPANPVPLADRTPPLPPMPQAAENDSLLYYPAGAQPQLGLARVQVTGLLPRTRYAYGLASVGENSPLGTVTTFPTPGTNSRLTLAFGSCAKWTKNDVSWREIADRAPDFMLHMGDLFYGDIATNDVSLFRSTLQTVVTNEGQQRVFSSMPVVR
ncbi:MAG: hypothetical protein BJ554DRAFT_1259 [Olpidium bornovanus]|uniref:Purple acid phosphatase n=1 Tax=Olpidium bornovanus TaxID=278681 RepID=A0A8H8A2J9_9FUNG|nr:MAG: hypothetical protein BJ554DRAFT_1259 [Olpidium bornovanus]